MSVPPCSHAVLQTTTSSFALYGPYKQPSLQKRLLAATLNGKASEIPSLITKRQDFNDGMTFPAPLALPYDDLTLDETEPQTVQEWFTEENRNPVTPQRRTIYVVPSPEITKGVKPMHCWLNGHDPKTGKKTASADRFKDVSPHTIHDVCDYIRAFYYGMKVKVLPADYRWAPWEGYTGIPITANSKSKKNKSKTYIGLETPSRSVVGVRCRPSPDGAAPMQVNLDDVLDALLENVPDNAYAIIMLVDLDMYETEDDGEIFTGGRAYGASRIAAVNCFREHPDQLPKYEQEGDELDHEHHCWPAAHCEAYVQSVCRAEGIEPVKKAKATKATSGSDSSPLSAAMDAARSARTSAATDSALQARCDVSDWFACVTKTAVHELSHCLGLDHCVYYACIAQGCANAEESLRQPAYVCPVCVEKIGMAIKGDDAEERRAWALERDQALRAVCERWKDGGLFAGLAAWLDKRIEQCS